MASDAAVVAVVAGVVGVAIVLAIVVAYLLDHWLYGTDPIGYEYGTSLHSARGEREPPPSSQSSPSPLELSPPSSRPPPPSKGNALMTQNNPKPKPRANQKRQNPSNAMTPYQKPTASTTRFPLPFTNRGPQIPRGNLGTQHGVRICIGGRSLMKTHHV